MIGVFDSGVGGISVLACLEKTLPHEDFLYYGDTLHAPYGTKPREEVLAYVRGVMKHLTAAGVKAVVIACNTATSVAAETIRHEYDLPIIGMEPALKPASQMRRGGSILVMATPVTLKLPKFQALMARYGEGATPLPCPGLMELVEQEDFAGAKAYLADRLSAFDPEKVDAVVLGCTHYVFLRPVLAELLPAHTAVVDGNEGTARQLRHVLETRGLASDTGTGSLRLESSGDETVVIPQMKRLLTLAREIM